VQMVGGGAGITLLPTTAVATETARAPVTVRHFREPAPFRTVALAWRKDGHRAGLMGKLGDALAQAAR